MCITDGVFDGSYVDMMYTMLPELKESQRGYLKSKRFPVLKNVVYIGQEKYRGMYNTPELLLLGENGTGKDLIARYVYEQSPRKGEIYVPIDLGSIPETLFESELFGFEKGAFTDAQKKKPGRLEVASGGTLFLNEIGNLSLPLQAKLLSVIEQRKSSRLGSTTSYPVDVRLICATNTDLYTAIDNGLFRQDLLYRINTIEIRIPPLHERGNDLFLLADHFLQRYRKKYKKEVRGISKEARRLMQLYRWPGNVRELKNITERISVIEENRDITASVLRLYLPDLNIEKYPVLVKQDSDQKIFNSEREILYQVLFDMKKDVNELKKLVHDIMGGKMPIEVPEEPATYPHPIHTVHPVPSIQEAEAVEEEESLSLEEVEKEMIRKALEKHNGRRKNAAADLKISERTLYRKIKEYNLE